MQTQSKQALAVIVSSFVRNVASVLVPWAREIDEHNEQRHAISGELLACILTMRDECRASHPERGIDVGMYLHAVVQAFGAKSAGGRGKKADAGALGAALERAGVNASNGAIRMTLYRARAVADWVADPANATKAADGLSFTECFNAAKPAKVAAAKSAAAKADPSSGANLNISADATSDTVQQIIAKIGLAKMLHACASILRASRLTVTDAAALDAIASKPTIVMTK